MHTLRTAVAARATLATPGCFNSSSRSLFLSNDQHDDVHGYNLLLRILLFADDLAALACCEADMRFLLQVIGDWATRRRLQFSIKSFYTPLCSNLATLEVIHDLRLQHLTLKIQFELFAYLGIPIYPYQDRGSPMVPRAVDKGSLALQLFRLQQLFIRGRKRTVRPDLWRKGLQDVVLAKHLYPTAVVDIDYATLDAAIRKATRRLFQLPPDYPSALLHWELRIWPTSLLGHLRALRFAHRLCSPHAKGGPSWFYDRVIRRCRGSASTLQPTVWDHIQHEGPIGRFSTLLTTYSLSWAQLFASSPAQWAELVTSATTDAYRRHILSANTYAAPLRQHVQRALTAFPALSASGSSWSPHRLPAYLSQVGDLGRVAMVFKGLALRPRFRWPNPTTRPSCNWCGQADAEHGHHLLTCSQLPAPVLVQFHAALQAIAADLCAGRRLPAPSHLPDLPLRGAFYRLTWRQQTTPTLIKVLTMMGIFINKYRLTLRAAGQPDRDNPIWRVQLGGQKYV